MSRKTGPYQSPARIYADQRGIIGLETAIVLIAFVVVASVFAFAVLNTGLLSSQKSEQAALGGLEETSATLSIRGDVIASANAGKTSIDTVRFNLAPASTSSESVDLSTTGTVVTYLDENQGINCENPQSFDGDADTPECSWSISWLIGWFRGHRRQRRAGRGNGYSHQSNSPTDPENGILRSSEAQQGRDRDC